MVPNKVWDQIATTMERLGKQHIGFHLCVSQSIARGLNSLGQSIAKQSQVLEAEVRAGYMAENSQLISSKELSKRWVYMQWLILSFVV